MNTNELYTCTAIFGTNGSGKTSLEQQYIDDCRAVGRPVFIIDPQDQYPNDPDAHWCELDLERDLRALKDSGWSGLIVFDDADLYLTHTAFKNSIFLDLFISLRHWQCDVVVVSRRPQEIPKIVMDVAKNVAVFEIRSPRARRQLKEWFDCSELMERLPKEPFKYLLVDPSDPVSAPLFETRRREIKTRADE